jgi:hypothetical protein
VSEPTRHATVLPSRRSRVVVGLIGALASVHSLLVMLWVMPANPIRQTIGEDVVTSYILNPVMPLDQTWAVFAPNPKSSEEVVEVRAFAGDAVTGVGKLTSWYSITDVHDVRAQYLITPPRAHMIPRRIMSSMLRVSSRFTPAQQQVLQQGFDASTLPTLRTALLKGEERGAAGRLAVDEYLRHEATMRRYFTLYARARWGPDVTLIQLRYGYRQAPPFADRHTRSMAGADVDFTVLGFRPVADIGGGDAQRVFDRYVDQAPPDDYDRVVRRNGKIVVEAVPK